MKLAILEPHLRRYGGIRRMVEFANRLAARGHEVVFLLPPEAELTCTWMRCDVAIRPLAWGLDREWDVVLFNHEPQWYLLERFTRARRRVFYALHDGRLYGKEGSWEAVWTSVDAQLANSGWTADQIESQTGHRPTVVLGGVNRDIFRPREVPTRYPLLCVGGERRPWKGTDTIRAAGRALGVPVEEYAPKDLSQEQLGVEYASARVFAVGSWFEGFCQPGLEALACGVPLVTTDNGGCREYAFDGRTALVVPPRDPAAMASAIERLLGDEALASELVANGLDVVARDFDWESRTDELATVLDGVIAHPSPTPPRPAPPDRPELSVVVLAWDNLVLTQRFVQSVRAGTDLSHELIVVDNGSAPDTASYARQAADVAIMNPTNLGFAKGMNQGLAAAKGEWIAFCNNDTVLPDGWASRLLETAQAHPSAGIVVPALTEARNPVTVRSEPGDRVEVLAPFSAPPAAVVYLMRADLVRALGGWGEDYAIASGEDVDLAFKVWVNDLDIVYDQRVLVEHVGKGSASRLDDWKALWARNRQHFLDKWCSADLDVAPRLDSVPAERFERNRTIAASVAGWMARYFAARDRAEAPTWWQKRLRAAPARRAVELGRRAWRAVRPHLPAPVVRVVGAAARRVVDGDEN